MEKKDLRNLFARKRPKAVGVGNGIEVARVGFEVMGVGDGLEEAVEGG